MEGLTIKGCPVAVDGYWPAKKGGFAMMLSVELSYYPLTQNYKTPVRELIEKLQSATDVEIRPNTMSTHLFGEYQQVMDVLSDAMRWSFENYGKAVFVAKFIDGDRR